MPDRKRDGNFTKDKKIHVRAMCGVQLKDRKRYADLMFMLFGSNNRSVGYGKQCSLIWSYIEERGWSCREKGIRF